MRLLLDTHALMWLLNGDAALSSVALAAISDGQHEKFLSVASLWEITIKVALGKLTVGQPLADYFTRIRGTGTIKSLSIEPAHLLKLADLPPYHRDPFDRILIAQALSERCAFVSRDPRLDAYGVKRLW